MTSIPKIFTPQSLGLIIIQQRRLVGRYTCAQVYNVSKGASIMRADAAAPRRAFYRGRTSIKAAPALSGIRGADLITSRSRRTGAYEHNNKATEWAGKTGVKRASSMNCRLSY